MDTVTAIQVYGIYGFTVVFFSAFGINILRRKRTRLSTTLAMFYLLVALAFTFNIVYRALDIHKINIILNVMTYYFGCLAVLFLLLFNVILLKSEKVFTLKKEVALVIIYAILLGMFFVFMQHGYVLWGYEYVQGDGTSIWRFYDISATQEEIPTGYKTGVPVWKWPFTIYGLIVTQINYGLTLYTGLKLRKQMKSDPVYQKKYTWNIIGSMLFDVIPLGVPLANTLNTPMVRTVVLVFSLLVFPAAFFVLRGLRQEKKK